MMKHTYPHVVEISTNGESPKVSELEALVMKTLTQSDGSRTVLKEKYWRFIGKKHKWLHTQALDTTKGRFLYEDNETSARVVLADVDSGKNYWYGWPKIHELTIEYRVNGGEKASIGFRASYDTTLWYDPKLKENVNSVYGHLRTIPSMGAESEGIIWLCPDDDSHNINEGYAILGKNTYKKGAGWKPKLDGTTFEVTLQPIFQMNPKQEINVFQAYSFDELKIINATVSDSNSPNGPSIEFETEGPHNLKDRNRVIVKGCVPDNLNIQSEDKISRRGIEVVDDTKFRVLDQYVSSLIDDSTIPKDNPISQGHGMATAYLDTSEFELLAESLAGLVDYNSLINKIKNKYGNVEIFKREMVSVGDRGKLVAWINEQLQILRLQNSSDIMYFDTDTYKGMISLKKYYKSINEELYNGLLIGQGCNRDTANLTGIQKTYCGSSSEPCGCYTLGCMIFQEATDNRLESHTIQSTDTEWFNGIEYIKFITDDPHGLVVNDNVIIEKCKLGLFDIRTKKGILIGTDREFFVQLNEYKHKDQMELTQRCYEPQAKVSLCQDLPSMNWEKLKQLNNSEQTTFIEKFSLNSPLSTTSGSKLYIPIQGLEEKIQVKQGWGALLRIYLVDSNKNKLSDSSQWGYYGNNVDYLIGSRDVLHFKQQISDIGLTTVSITYDKKCNVSSSVMGNSGSYLDTPSNGYLVIEILTVRSTYGEWQGYGVVLPADFGRVNGVAAVDKFIENMNQKFGLSGLSIKGGISVKLAAVLEILKIFEVKFGLITDASISLDSNSEITLTLDIGVFVSAGVDLGNIGLGDNSASGEVANLQRFVCKGRAEISLLLLSLMNPFLGKLAVEFSGKQLLVLKSMSRERITKETLKGTVTIPGAQLNAEYVNSNARNNQNQLVKQTSEWSYENKFNGIIGNFKTFGFEAKNVIEKDNSVLKALNLWYLKRGNDPIDMENLADDKWYLTVLLALAFSSGVAITWGAPILATVNGARSKNAQQLEEATSDLNEVEKKIQGVLKEFVPDVKTVLEMIVVLRQINMSPGDLNTMLDCFKTVSKDLKGFLSVGERLTKIRSDFKDLGSLIQSKYQGSEWDTKLGMGLTQVFPSSIDIAVGKSEINTLENYLNSDASLVDKCLSILEHQKTSPLPISFRDFTIVGSIEKKIELESPRVPLFTGVRIGAELEFKIYGEIELNVLSLLGMQGYNAANMEQMVSLTRAAMSGE